MRGRAARTMPPQLSNAFLSTDIPDGKVHILVLDCLYIETYTEYESAFVVCRGGLTNCWDGRYYLSQS